MKIWRKNSSVFDSKYMTYSKSGNYRFRFVDGHTESVTYLGKRGGMHHFLFSTGEVWTGYTAPVEAE